MMPRLQPTPKFINDPALKIDWPMIDMPILLSEKDQKHPPLAEIELWEM